MLCAHDRRGDDRLLGALPPVPVVAPWWPEAWDVVEAVRQRFGIDVTVLRLLTASRPRMPGGTVSYLAEVDAATDRSELPLTAWTDSDPLAPEPLRQSWAHPDGPRRLVAWAHDRLEAAGIAVRGKARARSRAARRTAWASLRVGWRPRWSAAVGRTATLGCWSRASRDLVPPAATGEASSGADLVVAGAGGVGVDAETGGDLLEAGSCLVQLGDGLR